MLREEHTWTILMLEDQSDVRNPDTLKLGLRVRYEGRDVTETLIFDEVYEDTDWGLERLRRLLFAVGLLVTDVHQLRTEGRLGDLRRYVADKPTIEAVAQLRFPRPGRVPYMLTKHSRGHIRPGSRDSMGLPPVREALDREKRWLQQRSRSPSGTPDSSFGARPEPKASTGPF